MNKKALAVAVAAALTAPMAAQAVSTSWYGQVNRAVQFVDDGRDSEVNFVDSTASSTRMGWIGTADAGNGVTAGAQIEYDIRSNAAFASTGSDVDPADTGNGGALGVRHAYVWFSGDWGKLSMGHTSDASDSVVFASYNSAWLASEFSSDWGPGVEFQATNGTAAADAGTIYSYASSFDGSRRDVVRYDTPSFGPISAQVSAGTNSRFDASVRFSADVGGGSMLARLGYGQAAGAPGPTAGGSTETISGSASYLFSSGTFIDGAYGTSDLDAGAARSDPDTWYVALGHNWGNNSAVINYLEGSDVTQGCELDRIGVGFVHKIPEPKVELFTGYHHYTADCDAGAGGIAAGSSIEDLDVFTLGARVRFD